MNELKIDDKSNALEHSIVQRPRNLKLAGYAVWLWSIAYMLPHYYWARGGTLGMSLIKPSVYELPQWELINWYASFILTLAGLLGIALVYCRNRVLQRLLLTIAWAGCSVAASHGIYGIIDRVLQITGVINLNSVSFNFKKHAYVVWDLLLFEPWFFIEGILLAILGGCFLNKKSDRRIWLIICAFGVLIGLVSGLLGVRIF